MHQEYCVKFDNATNALSLLITGMCALPPLHPGPFPNPLPPIDSPHLKRKFDEIAAAAAESRRVNVDPPEEDPEDPYGFDTTPGPVGSGCGLCGAAAAPDSMAAAPESAAAPAAPE